MPSSYVCARPAGGPVLAGPARAPPLLRAATFFFPSALASPSHLLLGRRHLRVNLRIRLFLGCAAVGVGGVRVVGAEPDVGGGGRREGGELRCDAGQGGRGKCGRAERTRRGARARPGPSPCSPIPLTRARPRPGLPPRTPGCGATGSTCRTPPRSWRATLEGRRAGILVQKKGARGRGRRRGVCVCGRVRDMACVRAPSRRWGGRGGAGVARPGKARCEKDTEREEKKRARLRARQGRPFLSLPSKNKKPILPFRTFAPPRAKFAARAPPAPGMAFHMDTLLDLDAFLGSPGAGNLGAAEARRPRRGPGWAVFFFFSFFFVLRPRLLPSPPPPPPALPCPRPPHAW